MIDDERYAASEAWTDGELASECARLTDWIHRQHLPITTMAQMLLQERAMLRERAEFAEQLVGLDWGRMLADTLAGFVMGAAVVGLAWWCW